MITVKELKDRWKSPINEFWKKVQQRCLYTIAALGIIYGMIATLQATGLYTAPTLLIEILSYIGTLCIGIIAAAKFTKTDLDTTKVATPEDKVEAIKDIINVPNKEQ